MRLQRLTATAVVAVAAAGLVACSSNTADANTINWWTWDDKQAAGYQACADKFHKDNPDLTVKISQYAVEDYFTKLTAGFVAGDAPDAFQNSVQFFQAYTSQHQLLALDDLIKSGNFDLSRFSVGVDAWKYTDGKQYALPLDWAATGIFYDTDAITKAGYTPADVATLSWNPDNGGTFGKMVAHLTVDEHGKRGDQPGFDKSKVAVYGFGQLAAKDFIGQTTWSSFVSTMGWRQGDKPSWPAKFNYADPRFVKTMDWVRSLTDRGFAPKIGEFTTSEVDQLASGKVAMLTGGSWTASTFAKIPNMKVGIAPTVLGPDGRTRSVLSNSNGNNIWAGTPHPDLAWKWVSYMGSQECQTMASKTGTFFPSIAASMDASAAAMAKDGIDLSVFTDALSKGVLYPSVVYGNGAELQSTIEPLFEQFFAHSRDADVFAEMERKSRTILAKSGQS
ncbi:sugar ABC transporter substrate-binding protein [Actinophytocola sp.]|jgi:multiple sugar transport system substrate-binding protein|uniref:ABC transporter substrate-binding protein n=1 Tax=Actinophytocola sp. TaxID=1872138 RepID=UPI002ED91615